MATGTGSASQPGAEDVSEELFQVEKILDERKCKGRTEFLLSWVGYDASHNSWEPEANILDAGLILEFNMQKRNAADMVRAGKAPASGATARTKRRWQAEQWLVDLASNAEFTPLFQDLDLESLAALACAAKAWQHAIDDFRAVEPRMGQVALYRSRSRLDAAQFVKRVLPRYVNLQHLDINDFHSMEQAVRRMLPKWPGLRSLNMGSCRRDAKMDRHVKMCSGLPSLRELTLQDPARMTDADLESLLGSPQLRRLCVMENGTRLQPASLVHALTEVANGPGCPLLEQLFLQGCVRFEHAMLSAAKSCPGLRVLDLSWCCHVTDKSIVAIGRACPRLEVLRLQDCRLVGPGGVTAVADGCEHLKELNLCACSRVTSDSVVAVARGCPQLEHLVLVSDRSVGDSAFCALAQGCRRLRAIDTLGTQISAAGLTALLSNPLLTQLHITSSRHLSQEAIKAAFERYPKVGGMCPGRHINLKVLTQTGAEFCFKGCGYTTPLRKLMHAFCNHQNCSMGSVRFFFDGIQINETQAPSLLEMEDCDVIDVMLPQ